LNAIQKISIADVELTAPEKYILSISLRIDGLSFLIQNREKESLHLEYFEWLNVSDWKKTIANLSSLIAEHELLKLNYPKVQVFVQSPHTFIIPENLFSEKSLNNLYNQYLGIDYHTVQFTAISDGSDKAYLVFGIDKKVAQALNTKWNVQWNHSSKYYLDNCLSSTKKGQQVHLNFRTNYFEVAATNEGKLQAHNYFEFSSTEEFIFNLLSFIRQIGFDVEKLNLQVTGKVLKTAAIYKLMEKYIPNVYYNQDEDPKGEVLFEELTQAANYENR
jgi:hypothetical protein